MSRAALAVVLLDFAVIGALPLVFFRRSDGFNLRWWATAIPFFLCPALLAAAFVGRLPGAPSWAALYPGQDLAPLLPAVGSVALIFLTLGTHQSRISLWHQSSDRPQSIVTAGAYRYIRHPFYTSFLLAFAAADLLLPHPAVLALSLYAFALLLWTARGEEKRLSVSEFGSEYTAYISRTGRFFPAFRRSRG